MKTNKRFFCMASLIIGLMAFPSVQAEEPAVSVSSRKLGFRGGIGTDISGGIAYGGGVNYLITNSFEFGLVGFGGTYVEEIHKTHTYTETTKLLVVGFLANYFANYDPEKVAPFFIAGFGLASISGTWEERSKTDTSLGTPLAGGGSKQERTFGIAGPLLNIGLGLSFGHGIDIRFEVPVIYGTIAGSSYVIPTFILTLGYRF